MAKFTFRNAYTQPLTKDLTTQFSTMLASPTERPLDDGHLEFLSEKAAAGLLVSFYWAIAHLDGKTYRVILRCD